MQQPQQVTLFDVDDALLVELLAPLDTNDAALALQPTAPELFAVPSSNGAAAPAQSSPMPTYSMLLDDDLLFAETEVLLGMVDPTLGQSNDVDSSIPTTANAEDTVEAVSVAPAHPAISIDNSANNHSCSNSPARKCSSTDDTTTATKTTATTQIVQSEQPGKRSRRRGSKPGSMRNPSRERLLNELDYLREQVVVLETELQTKQQQQQSQQQQSSPRMLTADSNSVVDPALALVAPKYERIAKRQRASCERATTENKRLRSLLALQRELITDMEETLVNWQHMDQQALGAIVAPPALHKTVHIEPGDGLLFEMLVSELATTYMQINDMFRSAGLDALDNEPLVQTTAKTRSTTTNGLPQSFFEIIGVDVAPFEFEMLHRVVRICSARQATRPNCVAFTGHWSTDGSITTEKYDVKRKLNGADVSMHMLLARKEHVFVNRVVAVWRCMFRCAEHFPGMYVQETGASVSVPLTASSSDGRSTVHATLTKACVHLEPKQFTATSASTSTPNVQAENDPMTVLVMDAYHDDTSEINGMMKNMMLEESLKPGASRV